MNVDEKNEIVSNFMAFTGADDSSAEQYLEVSDWKLEAAVNMFMAAGPPAPAPADPMYRSAPSFGQPQTGDIDAATLAAIAAAQGSDSMQSFIGGVQPPQFHASHEDPSLALARHLQSQEEQKSGQAAVRRPDEIKKERLIADASKFKHPMSMNGRPTPRQTRRRTDPSEWMFPPPDKINFTGTFVEARTVCKERKRWLLVNIQSVQEFPSHQLNRDTWSEETIQSLLSPEQGEFTFWQATSTEEEGQKYLQNYHVNSYTDLPHIAIIDPRTGEMVQKWKGFVDAQELATDICSFCASRSLHVGARPDRAYSADGQELSQNGTSSSKDSMQDIAGTDKDPELAAAIAMSMREAVQEPLSSASTAAAAPPVPPTAASTKDEMATSSTEQASTDDSPVSTAPASMQWPLTDEPVNGTPNSTRIQIRLTNGKSVVRRFLLSDPVGMLTTLVQQEVQEARARAFDLQMTFPRKSLQPMLEMCISEAGLSNAAVVMKWLD